MKWILMFLTLSLTSSALARGGQDIGNGGDALRKLMNQGKAKAVTRLNELHSCMLSNSSAPEVRSWIVANRERMAADLADTDLVWHEGSQESCGWTARSAKQPIYLSYPSCRETIKDLEDAEFLLLHETVHHFDIADEDFADNVALEILRADSDSDCGETGNVFYELVKTQYVVAFGNLRFSNENMYFNTENKGKQANSVSTLGPQGYENVRQLNETSLVRAMPYNYKNRLIYSDVNYVRDYNDEDFKLNAEVRSEGHILDFVSNNEGLVGMLDSSGYISIYNTEDPFSTDGKWSLAHPASHRLSARFEYSTRYSVAMNEDFLIYTFWRNSGKDKPRNYIQMVDLDDVYNMTISNEIHLGDGYNYDHFKRPVKIYRDTLLVPHSEGYADVFDMKTGDLVRQINVPEGFYAWTLHGDMLYVAYANRVSAIDISNGNGNLVGDFQVAQPENRGIERIHYNNGFVYVLWKDNQHHSVNFTKVLTTIKEIR